MLWNIFEAKVEECKRGKTLQERGSSECDTGPSQRVNSASIQRVTSTEPTQRVTNGAVARTRSRLNETRTLTQNYAMMMMEMKMNGLQLSAQQTVLHKFSLAFFCEWAGAVMVGNPVNWMQAVMDDKLGKILIQFISSKRAKSQRTDKDVTYG